MFTDSSPFQRYKTYHDGILLQPEWLFHLSSHFSHQITSIVPSKGTNSSVYVIAYKTRLCVECLFLCILLSVFLNGHTDPVLNSAPFSSTSRQDFTPFEGFSVADRWNRSVPLAIQNEACTLATAA